MQTVIVGDGPLGWAVASALSDRGQRAPILGRPPAGRHDPAAFHGVDLVVEASRGESVVANVEAALDAGVRRLVIATTGWSTQRETVDHALRTRGASAVVAANFSPGVALFIRLVEAATDLFGNVAEFDPYLIEWHRRSKADRPSGTALELADRIARRHPGLASADDLETVSVRAGASPGMHLVGFDAAGETVELRLTARDRTPYAAGILAAADWLRHAPRAPGIHSFDTVVDDLLGRRAAAA